MSLGPTPTGAGPRGWATGWQFDDGQGPAFFGAQPDPTAEAIAITMVDLDGTAELQVRHADDGSEVEGHSIPSAGDVQTDITATTVVMASGTEPVSSVVDRGEGATVTSRDRPTIPGRAVQARGIAVSLVPATGDVTEPTAEPTPTAAGIRVDLLGS